MLIVLGGLPGAGKTTIARELARALGAMHVRIDSIEQALRHGGWHVESEGYEVAYAVSGDNLALGRIVVADCVNPWPLTRRAWRSVADAAGARHIDVEIVCSNPGEHRRRVESRCSDIPGHRLPTWTEVTTRDYGKWDTPRIVIDSAKLSVDESVAKILSALRATGL